MCAGTVRDCIELTSNFTAQVNVDMKVVGVEETVTVSGEAPIVDVQNVLQGRTVTTDFK